MLKKIIGNALLILFVAIVLVFSVRGLPGNPTPSQLNTRYWKENGPFELSPERGRYALLYSLIENHSFHFSPDLANFTAPDVGYFNNNYVDIFAPSISFLAIPGYIIGKHFDVAQFGTFVWMSIFALLNVLLIRKLAIRLGAHPLAATVAGITFLFATPAFAYAVTFYEHHVSTFLILLSLYLLITYDSLFSLLAIWVLYAFSFTVDYPNIFMMFPIALTAFLRSGAIEHIHNKVRIKISFPRILSVAAVIIPLLFLLWFNKMSYNNPFRLSGSVQTIVGVKPNGAPLFLVDKKKVLPQNIGSLSNTPSSSILTVFKPRNMMNGLYIFTTSPDRGIFMYTPVILFGIWGMYLARRKKNTYIPLMFGVIGFDVLLYAMWGDPYGGWAFGSRYLIPTYAILAIYIALFLTYLKRNKFVLLFFFIVLTYSVMVNTLGALTSNSNPPQVQAVALSNQYHQPVLYTYMRNVGLLNANISRSYIFQSYANNYVSAWQYYAYATTFILMVSLFTLVYFYNTEKKKI